MLESWVLVIEIYGFAVGERNKSSRTRDLPHDACLVLVQEVRGPRVAAYCYRAGEPDPGSNWAQAAGLKSAGAGVTNVGDKAHHWKS